MNRLAILGNHLPRQCGIATFTTHLADVFAAERPDVDSFVIDMVRMLHGRAEFSDRFLAHMLTRNIQIEEHLVDQLFNSSEKRLARTLLLLARYGKGDPTPRVLPKLSQETLATTDDRHTQAPLGDTWPRAPSSAPGRSAWRCGVRRRQDRTLCNPEQRAVLPVARLV